MWSIYKKDQVEKIGSDAWKLAQKYPYAVSHDGTNIIFVEAVEESKDTYVLPDKDNQGNLIDRDQQALIAGQWLYSETSKGLLLTQSQAERLFTHPYHRLWCATYTEDQMDLFEADYNYVGNLITANYPDLPWPPFNSDLTPAQARAIMLQGLGG